MIRTTPWSALVVALLAAAPGAATPALATLSAADRCVADKTGAVSKYSSCALKARRTLELTGDDIVYAAAVARCAAKQDLAFGKAETLAGGLCPVDNDSPGVAAFSDACFAIVVDALGGAPLPADLPTCYGDLSSCQSGLDSCTGDLVVCSASVGTAVLKTGQTICANTSGTVIPCAATGQDGENQVGVAPAYTDNGDGTITDTQTKLMWEKLSNDGGVHDKDTPLTWLDGLAKIQTLNSASFGGHADWRMPNIRELETLVNFGRDYPTATDAFNTACGNGCTVLTCNCTNSSQYWSSTTFETDKPCAWVVDFSVGARSGLPKTNGFRVRAVRTAS